MPLAKLCTICFRKLRDRYQELDRDNKGSRLFVLNTKVSEITPKQKEELNFYHYSFVTPVVSRLCRLINLEYFRGAVGKCLFRFSVSFSKALVVPARVFSYK